MSRSPRRSDPDLTEPAAADPVRLGDVVIVGGGCYGTFYAGQLERARRAGRATWRQLLVVDRDPEGRAARELAPGPDRKLVIADWGDFFDEWLAAPRAPDDAIVPSPLMPHLMFEWLLRRARRRWPGRPVAAGRIADPAGTPYDATGADGTRYLSFADWLCPTHCVEPALCPVIRAPRTWEMREALVRLTKRAGTDRPVAGPVVFHCRHRVFGVGMFDAAEVTAGDRLVEAAGADGREVDILVGTISSCHGAVTALALGPA